MPLENKAETVTQILYVFNKFQLLLRLSHDMDCFPGLSDLENVTSHPRNPVYIKYKEKISSNISHTVVSTVDNG